MEKNDIFIIHGTQMAEMAQRLAEEADLAGLIGDRRARVAIKPNLACAVPADMGGTTHPEIVEGLVQYLQGKGFHSVTIMEGSWVGDETEEAFRVCGYEELARRYGVRLLDTKKERGWKCGCAGMDLELCACVRDVDFLINVPVMKGHCQTQMTCALKNMKGLIPDREKRRFHARGLHRPIAHLNAGIRQDFILVDGICGDLEFEDGGNPVVMNRMFAGRDPVLVDAFCCSLMGIDTAAVPYIGLAEALGVGSAGLGGARIRELNHGQRQMPAMRTGKALRLSEKAQEVESCSACYGYLIPALARLEEEGLLDSLTEKVCIGQGFRGQTGGLGVGDCTSGFRCSLPGCPPLETEMYEFLKRYIEEGRG